MAGAQQGTKGPFQVWKLIVTGGGIKIGSKTIDGILTGTVSINPASIAATSRAATSVTIAGVKVGDTVVLEPPAALNDDLLYVGCRVTANDTVAVYLYNPTGGAIDDSARDWDYRVIRLS